MEYHFFCINARQPGDDQEQLNIFLRKHVPVTVDRKLVEDGADSFWSICVGVAEPVQKESTATRRPAVDYRELLPPEEFAVYARLRERRNAIAKADEVPPYSIFTNKQLADMVRLPAKNKAGMAGIDGIGTKRIERFADEFLALMANQNG